MRVAHIIRRSQRLRLQLHSLAEGVFSGAHRIRAWKTIEEIVRRPVFLNDDDHVLNWRRQAFGKPTKHPRGRLGRRLHRCRKVVLESPLRGASALG